MGNMELNEGHEQELMRLHEQSGRLMIACQEMAEAVRRLDATFKDTIHANRLQFNSHRVALKFYADIKKKCDEILTGILQLQKEF
jgi:hypothetical protein